MNLPAEESSMVSVTDLSWMPSFAKAALIAW